MFICVVHLKMGKSRNERKQSALVFNARASTSWSKDDSKFGQRMLEKMGWKKGQGLGIQNQGITENVKVCLKLDSKGLGFKIEDSQWLQVEREFSTTLSVLKRNSGITSSSGASSHTKSLESESLKSKHRVHYHKFMRGKDVSRYREKDLAGILGQSIESLAENTEFDIRIDSNNCDRNNVNEISNQKPDETLISTARDIANNIGRPNLDSKNSDLKISRTEETISPPEMSNRKPGETLISTARKDIANNIGRPNLDSKNNDLKICRTEEASSPPPRRKLSKAERIVEKNQLLKRLQFGDVNIEFVGTNLVNINGYGSCNIRK